MPKRCQVDVDMPYDPVLPPPPSKENTHPAPQKNAQDAALAGLYREAAVEELLNAPKLV
jgi:hypothetical protein